MWDFPLIPVQASTGAARVDALMLFELVVLIGFTLLIALLVLTLCVRYRRGAHVDRSNPPTHSNLLEASWIVATVLLDDGHVHLGSGCLLLHRQPPGDAQTIYVVGKQWMWKTQHPEGKREINELHIPLGRPIKLMMTSQDVIHSFFIPAFRVKQDVLPGRYTTEWFHPTKVGKYHLFCAEYCGTDHSFMVGTIHVMDPADYETWLTSGEEVGPSMAEQGKELFVRHHCAGCHGPEGAVKAPKLEGVYGKPVPIQKGEGDQVEVHFVTADDRYIRDSILLPKQEVVAGYKPVMPSFQGQIDEQDLIKIIEYIKSIGAEEAAE